MSTTLTPVSRRATTSPPVNRERMAEDLVALGLRPGRTVLLHSSLKQIGWVIGGALTVVRAFLDVLGPEGTLVVPTGTADNTDPERWASTTGRAAPAEWWPTIREHLPAFDPEVTPSHRMGRIAETVRTWPGAVRSAHPQSSFAALGPSAAGLMADHEVDCHLGEQSPLSGLTAAEADVVLLGVGYEVCTCLHLAEYRQPDPPRRQYRCVVDRPAVGRHWLEYWDVALDAQDFAEVGAAFEGSPEGGRVRTGKVGAADTRLVPIRPAVDFATAWLREHRPMG